MADSLTANYSWVKPDIYASDDTWGGKLNTNFDGIDATVKTVSNTAIGDNRLINGDMRIDQRNNGAAGTAGTYTVDRWSYWPAVGAKGTWQRITNSAADLATTGFGYSLRFTSSSAYTPAAAEWFAFYQMIEADFVVDFAWGSAQAQPVTLSFWAMSSLTGTFSGSIRNAATTRSYPFTFSLPTASTWTKIVLTIPGDTAGTWVLQGNAGSVMLTFDLGSGATYRGPAGAWAAGSLNGANGAVNVVATNAATLNLTGVKLEIGSVATPFNRQSLAKSLADCQRYYYSSNSIWFAGYGSAGGGVGQTLLLPVPMRAAPTVVYAAATTATNCAAALTAQIATVTNIAFNTVVTALGNFVYSSPGFTANAEL